MSADAYRQVLDDVLAQLQDLDTSKNRVLEDKQDAIPADMVPCVVLEPISVDPLIEADEGQTDDDGRMERHTFAFMITSVGFTKVQRDASSREVKVAVQTTTVGLNRRYTGSLFTRVTSDGDKPTLQVHQSFEVQYLVMASNPSVIL
jgi:hypothetical protein